MPLCPICLAIEIRAPRRRYCSRTCAQEAIRRAKRLLRAQTLAEYRDGRTTEPPWKDGWKSEEARKAYFREYMREWRRRRREVATGSGIRAVA